SPGLFDVVLSRKERGVSMHRVSEHSFVRVHFVCVRKMGPDHLRGCGVRLLSWRDDIRADSKRDVGADPEPAMIWLGAELPIQGGRVPESHDDCRACHGEMLARADVKGHTLPAPGIDPQTQGDKRLDLRVRGHSLFRLVPAKLTSHDVICGE